jgi:hypothetical protein
MPKKRLDVNWEREVKTEDFEPALKRSNRYLKDNGIKNKTKRLLTDLSFELSNNYRIYIINLDNANVANLLMLEDRIIAEF